MLHRQEAKMLRSLMAICNIFCFGEPDYWKKRVMCSQFVSIMNSFLGRYFGRKADKCCSILKFHCRYSKAHQIINLEMAKILKEAYLERISYWLTGMGAQKICPQKTKS